MRYMLLSILLLSACAAPIRDASDGGGSDAYGADPCLRGCLPLGPDPTTSCVPKDPATGYAVPDSGVDCAACVPSCLPGWTDLRYEPGDCPHPEEGCWRCLPVGTTSSYRGVICAAF